MVNHWKPILAALTIFATGLVTGALTLSGYHAVPSRDGMAFGESRRGPKPERSRDGHLRDLCGRLQDELRLNPAQRERIEEIVRLAHERVKAVADKMGPIIHSEFKQMERDILQELTNEQADQFRAIIRERESKFNRGDDLPIGPRPDEKKRGLQEDLGM